MYSLKLYDKDLLKFNIVENLADPVVEIQWIDEESIGLLPHGMELSNEGLSKWIKHRSIPKNRAYVTSFLAKCGLNANRPMDVVTVCKGLSLNDAYWVVSDDFKGDFSESNLYDNNFSRVLAWIAFTGYGSSIRSSFDSSPEFTTNGMLPKCWRRINGKILLYKGATSGASNTGYEPFSELYAAAIGNQMGLNIVSYNVSKWKGNLCSVCELFTSKDLAYVPIGRIVKSGGMKAVRDYYSSLGDAFINALNEMLAFDAIIMNTDRHYGNFGVLVDSKTNAIVAPAPLFDHGNSLLNFAGEENWNDEDALLEYANTLLPCVYEDYFEEAKKYLDANIKEKIRRLVGFELKRIGTYNYSAKKLKALNKIIQLRARMLLE